MSTERHYGRAGDRLDSLSSPCYTIPWQPRKNAKSASSSSSQSTCDSPFPVLDEYEADVGPSKVRHASYRLAVEKTEHLFDICVSRIYKTLFDDLCVFFAATTSHDNRAHTTLNQLSNHESNLYLPGFEPDPGHTYLEPARSIQTALLISSSAPWFSSFSDRLVAHLSSNCGGMDDNIVVTLSSNECTNLYTALRLMVARFITQAVRHVSIDAIQDIDLSSIEAAAASGKIEPDLNVLRNWWRARFSHLPSGPKFVLNLPAIESMDPTVFSDILSSLQAFVLEAGGSSKGAPGKESQEKASPRLLLILGITSPSGGLSSATGVTGSASAPAPWIDYIPRHVLRSLDISRFSLPSKDVVWSQMVQSFLMSRHLPLSIGPSTFEYIRQTYWEQDADLDSMLDALQLAWFIHFSGKPESVFTIAGQAQSLRFYSWTPKMFERIKVALLHSTEDQSSLILPLLFNSADKRSGFDLNSFLSQASQSDQFLLNRVDELCNPREVLSYRAEIAVKFFFRAFESLQRIQSMATTAAQAIQARKSTTAALTAQHSAELDEQRQTERASEILTQVVAQCLNASVGSLDGGQTMPHSLQLRSGLARLANAARRLLSDEFEMLLDDLVVVAEDEIRNMEETMPGAFESLVELQPGQLRSASQIILSQGEAFLAGLRTFQQKLAQTITAGTASMYDSKDDELVVAAMGDAAKHQREARLQRVQRKLLLEERLLGLKREITDWIVHYITELIDWKALLPSSLNVDFGPLHLLRNIYWVDCYGPLSTLLDPSTRLNLTLPMSEPNEFLESLHETAFSTFPDEELAGIKLDALKNAEVPDICRMYQLYRECGKFVNLADWFEAFKQTVELDGTLKTVDLELNQDLLRNQATQAEDEHATGRNGNTKRRLRRNANSGSPVSDVLEEDGDTGVDDDDDADADIRDPANSGVASSRTKRRSSRSGAQKRINLVESDYDSEVQDTPSKRRRRQQQGAQAQPASAAPAENGAVGDLQARFALALNELARMGMLRGTRRRQEHITKVMWDLVPDVL